MELYSTHTLQVKYITASTGKPVCYTCTFIWQLQQFHTLCQFIDVTVSFDIVSVV